MRLGIEYEEIHRGTYYLDSDPAHVAEFSFDLRVSTPKIREFLRERSAIAEGTVFAEGLATHRRAQGLVTWKRAERRIAYSIEFGADDGRLLAFVGEKDLHPMLGRRALTRLSGSLFHLASSGARLCQSDLRHQLGAAELSFDLRSDFWKMLKGARLLVQSFSLGWPDR